MLTTGHPDVAAIHPLAKSLRVVATHEAPPLDAALDSAVASIWAAALQQRPTLFNGAIFSADSITPELITGHWTEYRRLVAQLHSPDLGAALGVRSLAVTGLLHGPHGVLLGQREHRAIYHAGWWQLPPAGSVDRGAALADSTVDLRLQLLVEARQELGLSPEHIGASTLICAVEHARTHVVDIGLAAEMTLPLTQVEARHRSSRDAEYRTVTLVPLPDLPVWLATYEQVVPSTPIFLQHFFRQHWQAQARSAPPEP